MSGHLISFSFGEPSTLVEKLREYESDQLFRVWLTLSTAMAAVELELECRHDNWGELPMA